MDGLGAGPPAGVDDPVDQRVALRRRRRPEQHLLVGELHVQRVGVGLGVDRDRGDVRACGRSG